MKATLPPLFEKTGCQDDRGFTLIEVMLAILYLSVGLLSTAAMIDIALSRSVVAKRLTIASNLATEMLDRMRFNSPGNASAIGSGLYPGVPFSYHGVIVCSDPAACTIPPLNCPTSFSGNCTGPVSGNSVAQPSPTEITYSDFSQWGSDVSVKDSNGVPLLPSAIGWVTQGIVGPPQLGLVAINVDLQWNTGLRRPRVTQYTMVANAGGFTGAWAGGAMLLPAPPGPVPPIPPIKDPLLLLPPPPPPPPPPHEQ